MSEQPTTSSASETVDGRTAFLAAMRRVAATISLVTTREDGAAHGMAATAVSSLSADPPTLLVCINRSASMHGPVSRVKWFSVNLLGEEHDALFKEFAARRGAARFEVGEWTDGAHGLPFLANATATLVCFLEQQIDHSTHSICIGRVESVTLARSAQPLLYQDGQSGKFAPLRPAAGTPAHWTVGNIIYPVADMERAIHFYRDVIGLGLKFRDGNEWAAFDCHGTTLALERQATSDAATRGVRASLKVPGNLDALAEKFRGSGAAIGAVQTGAHERTATLTDPDGNQIVLYAPLKRPKPLR